MCYVFILPQGCGLVGPWGGSEVVEAGEGG